MQIVEVKNNLVKASFEEGEKPFLSGFATVKDSAQAFIAQIIYLESNQNGNFAVLKLLFNFNEEGVITNYNGSIPSINGIIEPVATNDLLGLLPVQNPLFIGELAQQQTQFNLDRSLLEEKLLICSENSEDTNILVNNFVSQLEKQNKKVLIIDGFGNYEFDKKIKATKNFKLPLNNDSINFIYEKGLLDAKAETKATIQEIFLEVQEYIKNLPEKFLPFSTFKNVVDDQYDETELVELVLLKNKLLKYKEENIFAQEKEEFLSLKENLLNEKITVFDISKIDELMQREFIAFAQSVLDEIKQEFYVFINVKNENTDKKLLKQIFTTKKDFPIIISEYGYKYLKEIKQLSSNFILFAPIQQQNDFAGYSSFLNKLNQNEYIVWGKSTHHLPLIVKLEDISKLFKEEKTEEIYQEEEYGQNYLDEEINKDLNEIYTVPKQEIEKEQEISAPNFVEEEINEEIDLTEEDLDILDEINIENIEEEQEIDESIDTISDELGYEEPKKEEIYEEEVVEQKSAFSDFLNNPEEEKHPSASDIIPVEMTKPAVPIYDAEIEPIVQSDEIAQGDLVTHPKYGKGTVEKLITYGSKTLCSILFENVGRRLLDPSLAEIKKV